MNTRLLVLAMLLAFSPATSAQEEQGKGREHSIPLFMSNADPDGRQGFIRIINHSDKDGTVEIVGVDDAGNRSGPIHLSIKALQTVHLNSMDVEEGSEMKELPEGLGMGQGNWRLMLDAGDLDIEPLAYIRTTKDGFITSMHDVVRPVGLRHRVPIFNPATNPNQESWLRLINPGESDAAVTITGLDAKANDSSGSVELTVPAQGAVAVTAVELEEGASGIDGNLGDGEGKWSLRITADRPIQVMNLMDTPTGHLSNLSGAKREYLGAAGLWQLGFEDGVEDEGYLILLPDSRLYAWLPVSADLVHIARGTYVSGPGTVSGSGDVFESGKVEVVLFPALNVVGGSEAFELTAEYRAGDWIRGEYSVMGGPGRSFHGWAFTGFERGASTAALAGLWEPLLDDGDLPGEFEPAAGGEFEFSFKAGGYDCDVDGAFAPINPAFNVYEAKPEIECALGLLTFERDSVDLILAVMDAPSSSGRGSRAIVFAVVPGNEIALGALFDYTGTEP